MAEHIQEILTRRESLDGRVPPQFLLNKAKFVETSLPELPQPEPSAAEKLADWEGRAAMARHEEEEEAATRLEAFEQDLARRREALEAELKAFEQDVPRRREALKARLNAEKRELNEALEMEKQELEDERQLQACYLLKQHGEE